MKALKKTLLAAVALAALGMGSAHANIVDLFTEPATSADNRVRDESVGAGGCLQGTISGTGCFDEYGVGANILGGYRDLYVQTDSQQFGTGLTTLSAGGGFLNYSSESGVNGYGKVQWDGADDSANLDLTGLNSADLIFQEGCGAGGCDRFIATVELADFGFEYKITLYDMDGTGKVLTASTLFPVNSATSAEYIFDWFNLADGNYFLGGLPFSITTLAAGSTAGLNFQQMGAMQLELDTSGVVNLDLTLSSITKTVPEPGAIALVGVALLGLGATSRRRKSGTKA